MNNIQQNASTHPACTGDKAAGAWSWPVTSIQCRSWQSVELYLHPPPPRGVQAWENTTCCSAVKATVCSLTCHLFPHVSSVPSRAVCSLTCHLFPHVPSVPSRVICSLTCHLFPHVSSVPSRVICSLTCHHKPRCWPALRHPKYPDHGQQPPSLLRSYFRFLDVSKKM
jgi:hypothetical protein